MFQKIGVRFFISLGILLLVLPNIRTSLILIDFEINRDFIASVLCIEKDVTGSTCNGQCYLSKELKSATEDNEKSDKIASEKEIILFSSIPKKGITEYGLFNLIPSSFQVYSVGALSRGYLESVDNPPQVNC